MTHSLKLGNFIRAQICLIFCVELFKKASFGGTQSKKTDITIARVEIQFAVYFSERMLHKNKALTILYVPLT